MLDSVSNSFSGVGHNTLRFYAGQIIMQIVNQDTIVRYTTAARDGAFFTQKEGENFFF